MAALYFFDGCRSVNLNLFNVINILSDKLRIHYDIFYLFERYLCNAPLSLFFNLIKMYRICKCVQVKNLF